MPNRAEMTARLNELLAVKASARAVEDAAVAEQHANEHAEMTARHNDQNHVIAAVRAAQDDLDLALIEAVNAVRDAVEATPSPPEAAA